MKVGIVSDIHCNADGLRDALDVMGPIDELLCLGDAIFEYQFSNDVAAILKQVEQQLTRILGPVAKVLVRRAAANTKDVEALYA